MRLASAVAVQTGPTFLKKSDEVASNKFVKRFYNIVENLPEKPFKFKEI
jgi:hypothetical protein